MYHICFGPDIWHSCAILDDPEATQNDRFVALEMLKNAVISAERVLPMCQDTGTALINGERGERVLTGGTDGEAYHAAFIILISLIICAFLNWHH